MFEAIFKGWLTDRSRPLMSEVVPIHPRIVDPETCLSKCTCGGEHPAPGATLYCGEDACRIMAEDCSVSYGDQKVLLIDDPQTHEVAGADLCRQLQALGLDVESFFLPEKPHADDVTIEKVRAACQGIGLVISVGSGTINDLGKYSAHHEQVDFWTMPTAPSMNGYTSGIAAIKVKGVKRTLPALPPQRLYAIPSVIQQAPLKLRQAGFCDVLAKVVSDVDWRADSLLFDGSYCGLPSAMMAAVEHSYADDPEAIGAGDEEATMGLFHGLLISGVAMSLAGSSAPASGGEHLVSHFWDMREPITGRVPEFHGLQVGLGIILSAACYRRLANCDLSCLTNRAELTFSTTADEIPAIWGPYEAEVAQQFENKKNALLKFDKLLPQYAEQLKILFRQVRTPEYFADLFTRVGAPFSLEAFDLTRDEFILAALNSRAIRERITVFDLAAHAGVLEQAAEETLQLL